MRRDWTGQATRIVEIPLDQGIRTFDTGFTIGPQPRLMQNIHRAIESVFGLGGRYLQLVEQVGSAAQATMTAKGDAAHTNLYLCGTVADQTDGDIYVIGVFDTGLGANHLGIWKTNNTAMHGAGTQPINDATLATTKRRPAPAAWWPSQDRIYYGHPLSAGQVQQLALATGVVSNWSTPGAGTVAVTAMVQHLDRIFFSKTAASDTVLFTDPFDPATIRATSFITCPGLGVVQCLITNVPGGITASATAHLIIAGRGSIWVFDGDPQFGNAALRQLTDQVGIAAQSLAASTPYGVFFLGTDGQMYLIPPGAPGPPVPVGDPIRDLFVKYEEIPMTTHPSTLLWDAPYLRLWLGTKSMLELDLSNPDRPQWTGTHTAPNAANLMTGARAQETTFTAAKTQLAAFDGLGVYQVGLSATDRTEKIRSGYLYDPNGHEVELRRLILETTRRFDATPGNLTVRAIRNDGTSVALPLVNPKTTATPARDLVAKSTWAPIGGPVRAAFIIIEVEAVAGLPLLLHRLYAEIRSVPRQD